MTNATKTRERIRAHRDFYLLCDPFTSYSTLIQELKRFNVEHEEPLPPSAVTAIAQERTLKRSLVPKERTREYLIHHGKKMHRDGMSAEKLAGELRPTNLANCEQELSEDELLDVARAVVEGTDEVETENLGVPMSEVVAEEIRWLWDSRMPYGKITILDGDPGLGKSMVAMDIVARVSTGRELPDGTLGTVGNVGTLGTVGTLGGVVYMTAEDGLADTVRPRLDAAGADASKILALNTYKDDPITLPSHLYLLERAIGMVSAKLVVIDPFLAFLDPKLSANQDQQVRVALTPLKELAERTGVAVLLIRHLNKKDAIKALYRGGGSIGVIGAARSGMVIDKLPEDSKVRVLALTKHNLTEEAPSLTYTIETAQNGSGRVAWGDAIEMDADELVNPDTNEVDKAVAWLESYLGDGPLPSETIIKDADAAGIKERTLKRAKSAKEIPSYRDGLGGTWRWHLATCDCDTCKSKRYDKVS
jgi:hypothetical protein